MHACSRNIVDVNFTLACIRAQDLVRSASTAEMGALLQQSAALGQTDHFCALLLHALARGDAAEALMQTNKQGESVLRWQSYSWRPGGASCSC